jgi:hypothetical protein
MRRWSDRLDENAVDGWIVRNILSDVTFTIADILETQKEVTMKPGHHQDQTICDRIRKGLEAVLLDIDRLETDLLTLRRERRRREHELLVFFLRPRTSTTEGKLTMQIFSNDPNGLNLALAETSAGVPVPLSAGPFTVTIADPNNTITDTEGSPDQTTPDNYKPNGTGNVGTVTVTVTDTSNNLVGTGSFDVVAPTGTGTGKADTLLVSFVPAAPAAAAAASLRRRV